MTRARCSLDTTLANERTWYLLFSRLIFTGHQFISSGIRECVHQPGMITQKDSLNDALHLEIKPVVCHVCIPPLRRTRDLSLLCFLCSSGLKVSLQGCLKDDPFGGPGAFCVRCLVMPLQLWQKQAARRRAHDKVLKAATWPAVAEKEVGRCHR